MIKKAIARLPIYAIASTEKTVGAIRTSPFYSGQTQRFVVHQLTRYPKKNSYGKINYPLLLELHPAWSREFSLYQQMQQLQQLNQPIPQRLLKSIYGEELFEGITISIEARGVQGGEPSSPHSREQSDLPLLEAWKPSKEDIEEVRSLWRENNWSQEELLLMLRSRFGISEIKEIQTFNQEKFEEFKEALKC